MCVHEFVWESSRTRDQRAKNCANGGRGVKDKKKRRNKINTPGVKVKQSSLQCVPPLHTFFDNAKEYLMTSALLTHISINVG